MTKPEKMELETQQHVNWSTEKHADTSVEQLEHSVTEIWVKASSKTVEETQLLFSTEKGELQEM